MQTSQPPTPSQSQTPAPANFIVKTDIVIIGAGQAGLSAAYHLKKRGLKPGKNFIVLDQAPRAGGAWQYRWPSLTLSTVNRIHDLPGMPFSDVLPPHSETIKARDAVPVYFEAYETKFDLSVYRPTKVAQVTQRGDRFRIETDRGTFSASGIVNATGTWENPHTPVYPGAETFKGQQLHTKDYNSAEEFIGKHVVIVGAGISAVQLLDEISRVTSTSWVTRHPITLNEAPFTEELGRNAVAMVEKRVRSGLPPSSVVSVTGLPATPATRDMQARGVFNRLPMFEEITETGIRWADGTSQQADVILWCTGFRGALDHLDPLNLREYTGGIVMTGRLATQVAKDTRIHLAGYGPSASTVGANRAGSTIARELLATLDMTPNP